MAINIFTGAITNNWNLATNWSLGSIPTASDGNITTFNITSPNCTMNTAGLCNNIDFSTYTNTLTTTNGITISGNITFGSGLLFTGTTTNGFTMNATGTITFNGLVVNRPFITSGTITVTLADNGTFKNNITLAGTPTINQTDGTHGNVLYIAGSSGGNWGTVAGNTKLVFGSMTFSNTTTLLSNNCDVDINTVNSNGGSGTIFRLSSTGFVYGTNTFKYISGTCDCAGSFFVTGATCSLDLNSSSSTSSTNTTGCNLFNYRPNVNATTTLISNLTVVGTFSTLANISSIINGNNIYLGGNITMGTNTAISGTSILQYIGAGTWTNTLSTNNLFLDLILNSGSTLTLQNAASTLNWGGGHTFSATSGTLITTGNTLTVNFSAASQTNTIDINGNSFNNLSLSLNSTNTTNTLVIASTMSVAGNFNISNSAANNASGILYFSGAAGWSCSNLANTAVSPGYTFKFLNGKTYTISSTFSTWNAFSSNTTKFISDSAGTQFKLKQIRGNQDIYYLNFTDCDASGGSTIWTNHGTLSNTLNINAPVKTNPNNINLSYIS